MTRDNLIQAIAIIAVIIIASIPGIWFLSADIEGVRSAAATQVSVLSAKLAADEERIAAMERLEVEHHSEEITSRTAIASQLNAVIQALADVRVDIGRRAVR